MGCCPVPVEWDHPETTSGHCEPWKQLIGLRPKSWYTKCLERGWVAATIWYHSIHEWSGTYMGLFIFIFCLLRNRNHVAVKRSSMLKMCTQFCSTDFRRTFLPLSGMICMLGKPCRGYHLPLALAPLNGLPLHGRWLWPCCKKCFIVDCAQVLWPTILPLALLARKDENSAVLKPFKAVVWRSVFQFT